MITYIEPKLKKHIEDFYNLCLEYADSLGFDLDFQGIDRELASLPGVYAPPEGCILLAVHDDQAIGCVALRNLEKNICEMKRLYIKPEFRGEGVGRELSKRIVQKAKDIGYKKMRLDTVSWMKEAIAIYRSLGFQEIAPYYYNPVDDAIYFELAL